MPRQESSTRKCILFSSTGADFLFAVMSEFAQCAPDPLGEPRIAPQPLRQAIAQHEGNAAPAERHADIGKRKLPGAEPALEGIVADAQVELADAILVQRSHGALDDEAARRTVRPPPSGIADAQEDQIVALPDAE